ncbi:hypothetical protein [Sagittula sp. S175]|uniref:hypothetical protein n=1 Tax=Sagittula sp. S175 TaxID=3415129 RepID=UPI003C7D880A
MSRLTCLLCALAAPVGAEEILLFVPPEGFVQIYAGEDAAGGIVEFVPEGQTLDDWQQMASVTWANALGGEPPRVMVEALLGGMAAQCPDGTAGVLWQGAQYGYDVEVLSFTCPVNVRGERVTESTFAKVIGGVEAAYTILIAWQGAAEEAVVQGYMDWTVPQGLCITDDPARACPDP